MRHLKTLINDENGSVLPITAGVIVILIAVAAVALDYARFTAASEKLKTAGDAAAVAGAVSATRYVTLLIDPGSSRDCCGDETCNPCCVDCGDEFTVTGKERDLIEKGGWERYCCSCGCDKVEIIDRWVQYDDGNAEAAAQVFFDVNIPKEMSYDQGGDSSLDSVTKYQKRGDSRYPSVVVRTAGRVKTLFLDFLNRIVPGVDFSYIKTNQCSQGGTYYYDLNGKYHRIAGNGCN